MMNVGSTEMARMTSLPMLLLLAGGCTAERPETAERGREVVSAFSQLPSRTGQTVTVDGYISSAHEARGLYFRESDLRALNSQFIQIDPEFDGRHGARVRLSGRLLESPCASERICITACRRFVLVR
jgi:hypothetical protein